MSNKAFDARLQAMSAFFLSLIRPLVTWMLFMTVMRFIVWFSVPIFFVGTEKSVSLRAFFTGARFDLLVLGFLLIPVLLLWLASLGLKDASARAARVSRGWLTLAWWIVTTIAAFDWLFFAANGRRMTFHDLKTPDFVSDGFGVVGTETAVIVALIFLCCAILGARQILQMPSFKTKTRPESGLRRAWRVIAPVLAVALMARGTLTPHHLEKQHSEVSSNPALNQLVLTPAWAFDKDP